MPSSGEKDDNECENATQPCGEHANCTNTVGSYFCMCMPGFKSSNGQQTFVPNDGTSCVDVDECSNEGTVACGDHAKCENVDGGFNCSCKEGYQPSTGKLQFKPNDGTSCQENPKAKCELFKDCITEHINRTLARISHLKTPLEMLQEINKNTLGPLLPVDVVSYVEALSYSSRNTIRDSVSDNEALRNTTINVLVNTVNNFLQKDKITVWEALPVDNQRRSLTKLLHTAEQATLLMSQNFKRTTQLDANASDIALKVFAFDSHHMKHIHPHVYTEGDYIKISPKKRKESHPNAAFAWMCIEGIHLYLIVVGVIYNKGFLHKNFYVFGYVSPAVVVGISAALGYKYYGTTEVCWLSTKNNFIWSFIGPACLIILVNLLAFGVIIYKVFRHTAMLKPEVSCYENIRSCARGALALLFLLGATWIFGVLHVVQGSVVTAYLFTIFNAFQGMFIFIFLCVLSRKDGKADCFKTIAKLLLGVGEMSVEVPIMVFISIYFEPAAPVIIFTSKIENVKAIFHASLPNFILVSGNDRYFNMFCTVSIILHGNHFFAEPDFSENKVYTFDYESTLLGGLPEKGLARAGIRLKSKVEISGIGPKLCLIRIHSIEAAEYNGVWPTSSFSRSLKLTQVLTGQLSNPIKFEYSNGHVGNIMAPDSVSDDGLNIYRGIMNVLELSIKKMQHSYSLQEAGIGGICNTTYAIQENKRANLVYVTKSKDLNSCEEKVQIVTGSAYTYPCQTCQKRNKNSQATATYNYKIKYTRSEAVITQADVEEIHQFAPFNEITGGNAIVQARQKLTLTDVQKQRAEVPPKEYQNRGSLQYEFGSELLQLPVHLFKIKDVESQIGESLQDLVEATSDQLPSDAPAKALKLMHLFRAANEENYESVWKQFSSRPVYRRYILDIIPAVASHRALRFLRHKMERQELTNWEAAQTLLVALHSCTPTRDVMEEATLLHGFAGEALSKSSSEEISLSLKALGNVGHPASIKHIKKFLPGYAAGASDLPLKVHATAVMALKNIGLKDPKMVQTITLEIFLNHKIHPRIRMLAVVVLLETKPGLPIVMTLADAVLKEPSMQVASFIYSHLRALGRSTAPDLQVMASACRMAIRALSPKFDRSGYQFSKVFRFSVFKEFLMSGLAAKYLVLNNAGSLIPTMAMSQLRTHFLGRVADPLEVGITVEGLQEMFAKGYSPDKDWENDYDFKKILKTLSDWKAFSSDQPSASVSLKMFGQELFFCGLDKNAIQNALQAWSGSDEKIPSLRRIISSLQSGVGRQWTKALLSSEIRRIVPTCTGFPTETSFYYSSITKVAGNVQVQITPSPKSDFRLTDLLNANIRLRSKMSLSMAKEMTFVMGINTRTIQAGLEAHTKMNAHVPVNVVAAVNVKEKNIKIELPPCKDETNIISIRSKTFAVTRNIGDLAASKMTPVLLPEAVPDIMKMSFDSDSASGETDKIRERQSAEAVSSGNLFSFGHSSSQKEPFVQSVCSNASTFGVQVCIERKSIHAAFIKNMPLYYLVGEHALRVSFKPVPLKLPLEIPGLPVLARDYAHSRNAFLPHSPEQRFPSSPSNATQHGQRQAERIYACRVCLMHPESLDLGLYTEAPIEKIQVTIQAGDQAPTKMIRLVKFEDPEAQSSSRKEAIKRLKKILDDTDDQGTRKHRSSSSSASSTSGSTESTTSSPSSSNSDERASQGRTQINMKIRQSKAKEKKFYPFGESSSSSSSGSSSSSSSGGKSSSSSSKSSSSSSSGSSSDSSSSKSNSSSSKSSSSSSKNSSSSSNKSSSSSSKDSSSSSKSSSSSSKSSNSSSKHSRSSKSSSSSSKSSSSSSKSSSSSSSSSSKSSSSSSKSSSSSSSSKSSSSSSSSKNSSSQGSSSSKSRSNSSEDSRSSSSSSTGSSSSSKASGIKHKAKKQSKTTSFPRASTAEGDRSVHEQKQKTQSSSSSSRSTSSGISSSESSAASHRQSKHDKRAETKHVKSQINSLSSYDSSTERELHLPKVYRLRFRSAHIHWRNFLGDIIPPGITIVAQAVRSDNKNQGYQATAYVRSDAAKVDVQLVVVQLAETNWKACADAVILPLKAQVRLRWGQECQDYRIAAVATTGLLARKPAAQLKVQWGKLPSWIKKTSTAFMQYLPGAAIMLGFSEAHQRNPSQEFIVRAAATSPRTIDTVIKAPGVTLYCQALRLPFTLPLGPSPTYKTRDITAWNLFPEIASQIAQEDQSTCEIRERDFKTFDRVSYSYSFNKSCNLIVAQDCTVHPKFIITTRKVDPQSFSREVHINTTSANITICPAANSSLLVACNEEQVLSHGGVSQYEKDNVKIYKSGTTVIVEVPALGLKKVTFDGVNLKVTVSSWMRGKTCGVCSNNDREKHNELLMPNHRLAHSCSAFVHSWVLLEETCSGGCKLQRSYVKLNRNPTIDGEESTCYSVDPVLKCMKNCTPIEKTSVKVGFHCFPKVNNSFTLLTETAVSLLEWQRSSDKKSASEDVVESVDADIDCTCTGVCS
ncbi:hypothetical protein WISP_110911 [Willisornis vidua]|uniref:VIT1 protein n=1 Tax=Willisornis vidua TaxID=1566151 RepID=A0ABQ9CVU5_9PASS|nr:hypothetical protein WISP_110911 [Willisornis vidua]